MKTWKITYKYCWLRSVVTGKGTDKYEHIFVAADSQKKAALIGKAVLDSWLEFNRNFYDTTIQMMRVYDAKSYEITNIKCVKQMLEEKNERIY